MITKLQYVEFLISTVANYTGTHLAEHLDGVSHDAITDFLQSEKLTARHARLFASGIAEPTRSWFSARLKRKPYGFDFLFSSCSTRKRARAIVN